MSLPMMQACWPLQMPPTPKAVLISLADNANDQGYCWPSLTTIAERTCFGRTAVIEAIRWLENNGVLKADRQDRYRTTYVITPGNFKQPELVRQADYSATRTSSSEGALVRLPDDEVRETDTNRKEPSRTVSKSNQKKAPASAVARPVHVPEQVWSDWLALRKAKRAPVTETVVRQAEAEARKAGMSIGDFLAVWCARGSQGLQADWLKPNERARAGPPLHGTTPSASADFRGKKYAGTPRDQLPAELRGDD